MHAAAVVGVVGKLDARAGVVAGIGVTEVPFRATLCTLVFRGAAALILGLWLLGAFAPVLARRAVASVHFSRAVISGPAQGACADVVSICSAASGVVVARVELTEIHLQVYN